MITTHKPRLAVCLSIFASLAIACATGTTFAASTKNLTSRHARQAADRKAVERVELLKTVERLTNRSSDGLTFEKLRNGATMVDLQGRFQHVSISRTNPDGSTSIACVSSAAEAEAFLDRRIDGDTDAEISTLLKKTLPTVDQTQPPSTQTVITIVNVNAPGVGFNDQTPATPVGGNTGTTLGQQRLIAFERAAQIWAARLRTNVPIIIQAQFTALGPGVLGSAGPSSAFVNFPNAPLRDTFYVYALANRLAGQDLAPQSPPRAQLATNFSTNFNFYLGLDNNAPPGQNDLLTVLLHEFAHGLGFLTLVNTANGRLVGATEADPNGGLPDIFARNLFDESLAKSWDELTPAQRQASAINTGNLTWKGPNVAQGVEALLTPSLVLKETGADATIQVTPASFGGSPREREITAEVVAADPALACGPLTNAAQLAGKIALIDRGTCPFVEKVRNAQTAGAIGAIIVNNLPGPAVAPGGDGPDITIPVVGISQADGNALRSRLGSGLTVSITTDSTRRTGTTNGRVRMFAPNPRQAGSSVSHFDNTVNPRLLMEPAINPRLSRDLDLTVPLFRDIGWFTNIASFSTTETGVLPAVGVASQTVTITSDNTTNWTVAGIPNWISGFPATGSGTVAVTFTVAANFNPGPRTATLTISPGGESLTITQNGGLTISAVSETSGQTTRVGTAFQTPLAVDIRDGDGNPVSGVQITFLAPEEGASGTFAEPGQGRAFTGTSDDTGRVTAPAFTANATAGTYLVRAGTNGSGVTIVFELTNTAESSRRAPR